MVCIMRCPLLSKLCSSNYLTLENEILTSFLPFFLLLLGRVWVESQEGNFRFEPASVQISAHRADPQKSLLPRSQGAVAWGGEENCSCWALVSFIFSFCTCLSCLVQKSDPAVPPAPG